MSALIVKIENNNLYKILVSKFRSLDVTGDSLVQVYKKLGHVFGVFLSNHFILESSPIKTPTGAEYLGSKLDVGNILFVSTFEDNDFFAQQIGSFYENALYAKLDVDRKSKGWEANIVKVDLPKVNNIDTVIFCKSVLATGCTAKTILNEIVQHYNVSNVIVTSILGSQEAIDELSNEFKYLNIKYLVGEIDLLDSETGLLMPGVGQIEERLAKTA